MNPTAKLISGGESGPALLGKMIGHHVWLDQADDGMDAQFHRAEEAIEDTELQLKEKWGEAAYGAWVKKWEALIAQIETETEAVAENFDQVRDRKNKISKRVMGLASEQNVDEQAEFFDAYARALRYPVYDKDGRPRAETYSSHTAIYMMLLVFWRHVRVMKSRRELHGWLCKWLGSSQVGEFERVEQICKRLKIRLARPGRPKTKK